MLILSGCLSVSFRFVKRFTYRPVRTKAAEIVLGQHKVVDLYALFTGGYGLKPACNKAAAVFLTLQLNIVLLPLRLFSGL